MFVVNKNICKSDFSSCPLVALHKLEQSIDFEKEIQQAPKVFPFGFHFPRPQWGNCGKPLLY